MILLTTYKENKKKVTNKIVKEFFSIRKLN